MFKVILQVKAKVFVTAKLVGKTSTPVFLGIANIQTKIKIEGCMCTKINYINTIVYTATIHDGNRTEWSAIWSVIARVINKIGRP